MASQIFQLIVRRGPEPNKLIALDIDIMTLGRDITNEITIADPEVSRHHARFTRGTHGYQIEDLGSTNGTFVAGQRLTSVRPLNPGDIIGFGETVILEYQLVRPENGLSPSSPTMPGAAALPQSPPQRQPQEYTPPQPQPVQKPGQQPQEYTPPQPAYDQQQPGYPPQQGYPPQPQPAYDSQPGYPPQPDYPPQQADYYGTNDYDPYAIREDQPNSMMNWLLIGCVVVLFFCCICTLVSLLAIDSMNLWYKWPFEETITPIVEGVKNALGF